MGGAGAGCGAVGLLGLLVSIGLVVWLGSRAFDGALGGGSGEGGVITVVAAPTTTAAAAGPGTNPVALIGDGLPMPADEDAVLTVQSATPGPAAVAACSFAGVEPGAVPPAEACGPTVAGIEVGADGTGSATVVVPSSIALADRTVDCRVEQCVLIVRTPDGRTAVASVVLAP